MSRMHSYLNFSLEMKGFTVYNQFSRCEVTENKGGGIVTIQSHGKEEEAIIKE